MIGKGSVVAVGLQAAKRRSGQSMAGIMAREFRASGYEKEQTMVMLRSLGLTISRGELREVFS